MMTFFVSASAAGPPLNPQTALTAWSSVSTPIALRWDVAHKRAAAEPTTVHVTTDGTLLYVRFDATQRAAVVASQHSNDLMAGGSVGANGNIAWSNDDAVWVDLWPTGLGGFEYQFEANAAGAHNESSTENVGFAPQWESHGAITAGGYTVTMAIPFAVVHGAHSGTWRAQFVRYIRSTGALIVWSYDPSQTNPDDAARAGDVDVPTVARAPIPRPRAGIYGLGALASRSAGGSTSRVGADFSIPVTQTAAFFGTLHPDYSNVELDQQSISPTVYQRIFSEVRPFFTQASAYYNDFNCDVCNGFRTTLYTPAIPTPSQGYAFEGRQGDFGLAGFDAIGDARTDAAAALNYTSPDTHWSAAFQHVTADIPGIVDDTNQAGVNWYNGKFLSFYANYAKETGTQVSDPGQGTWLDAGGGFV